LWFVTVRVQCAYGTGESISPLNAAFFAAAFFALLVILSLALPIEKIGGAATLAVVVGGPIVVYLIGSGEVSEIGGPGGVVAKFKSSAMTPVDSTAFVEQVQLVEKLGPGELRLQLSSYRVGVPLALLLEAGSNGSAYNPDSLRQYTEYIAKLDPFFTVIFVDSKEEFLASMDGRYLIPATQDFQIFSIFAGYLNIDGVSASLSSISSLFPISRSFIFRNDSNSTALKRMMADNSIAVVVLDERRKPLGIARRDRLVAQLMASLAA